MEYFIKILACFLSLICLSYETMLLNNSTTKPDNETATATDIPLTNATDIPVASATDIPVSNATDIPVSNATDIPVVNVTDIPVVSATDVPVVNATEIPVANATDVPVTNMTTMISSLYHQNVSKLDPLNFLNTAFNFDYPFLYDVPPLISYIIKNETLKTDGNFSFGNPYANANKTRIGDTDYYKVKYCGVHFINQGDGYILSDKGFVNRDGPERYIWGFVGNQFCTPTIECPRFAGKKGNCLTNYLQITDAGESFLLHFCDLKEKPGLREYTAKGGLLDITYRYTDHSKRPDFECRVKCVNYKVNFTTTGSSLSKENPLKVTVAAQPNTFESNLPEPKTFKNCKCGVSNGAANRTFRIVGGRETLVNQYPWTVGILSKHGKLPFCGASLINDRYVLTASHCVEDEEPEDMVVALNEHDYHNDTETVGPTIRRGVLEIIPFHYYLESTFYGDVALLKLDQSVDIKNSTMTPICLPPDDDETYVGKEVIGTGWGTTMGGPEGLKSPKLLEVPLVVLSNDACNDYHSHTPPQPPQVTYNMLCAGYSEGGRDTCAGDSGGSIVARMKNSGRFSQVGVTSWGFGCALKLNPGVFSRVSSFLYWIRQHTVDAVWCQ